jgi:hypothetical protein
MRSMESLDMPSSTSGAKFLPVLFLGVLSTVFAEVFSGSAPFWFADPWGLVVVLPLYWSHILLLLNIALRWNRTSLSQLYLFGVIFGLYESWTTKVIWAGYMGESPAFGRFLGFAVAEFPVIGLFWHAVFSFIVPLMAYQIVALNTQETQTSVQLLGGTQFFLRGRISSIFWALVFITGSFFLSMGLEMDILATAFSVGGNLVIIGLLSWLVSKKQETFDLGSVILGKRGLLGNTVVFVIIYLLLSVILFPERFPDLVTIVLTIMFYLLIIILLHIGPKSPPASADSRFLDRVISTKRLIGGLAIFGALSLFWCTIPSVSVVIATLFYLAMIVAGPTLFIAALASIMKSRLIGE